MSLLTVHCGGSDDNTPASGPQLVDVMPVVGHEYDVDFGAMAFRLFFETESSMTYTVMRFPEGGLPVGFKETVKYTKVEIRPNVYLVYWQESDKTTVTHYEDYEKKIVYSNITLPDATFVNVNGSLTPVDSMAVRPPATKETQLIPVVGNKFNVDFGEMGFELYFKTDNVMTYTVKKFPAGGLPIGFQETVSYTRVEIRPNVHFVYWKEADNTTVTHYEDFEKKIVYSNITLPGNTFVNVNGSFTPAN